MENLKKLEQKIFISYFQDGIIDLIIGIMFILDGFLMFTENTKFIGLAAILPLLITPLKKVLIVPRIGFVKLSMTREKKIKQSLLTSFMGGIVIFNIILIFVLSKGKLDFYHNYSFIFLAFFISLLPFIGALLTGIKRFYLYAIFIYLVFFHEHFTHSTLPRDFMIFGFILLIFGLYYFITFLKKYPLPDKEVKYE